MFFCKKLPAAGRAGKAQGLYNPNIMAKTIILAMLRLPVAQGLAHKLRKDSGANVIIESEYSKVISLAQDNSADSVLIEVSESGKYDAEFCLELCNGLRGSAPDCRRVIMCPETDELCVFEAVEALRDGMIDDFLFYDGSIDYLASKLLAK